MRKRLNTLVLLPRRSVLRRNAAKHDWQGALTKSIEGGEQIVKHCIYQLYVWFSFACRLRQWRGEEPGTPRLTRLCWQMKHMVVSGMAPARVEVAPSDRVATTMIRLRRPMQAYHSSGRARPCHGSPPDAPPSVIRQQSLERDTPGLRQQWQERTGLESRSVHRMFLYGFLLERLVRPKAD